MTPNQYVIIILLVLLILAASMLHRVQHIEALDSAGVGCWTISQNGSCPIDTIPSRDPTGYCCPIAHYDVKKNTCCGTTIKGATSTLAPKEVPKNQGCWQDMQGKLCPIGMMQGRRNPRLCCPSTSFDANNHTCCGMVG